MIRVGIFFGGQSREREISFAGGRTVYDNLSKSLFEAVPIFVDGLGKFILLEWQYLYKGTIRDFYPPSKYYPESEKSFQLYIECLANVPKHTLDAIIAEVGTPLEASDLVHRIDIAFLALHGTYGEDGSIQGLLDWYGIPYTGCSMLPSAIGMDKMVQKQFLSEFGFEVPDYTHISRNHWLQATEEDRKKMYSEAKLSVNLPFVVKAPNQGSSIGISVVKNDSFAEFELAINKALFVMELHKSTWSSLDSNRQHAFVAELIDIRYGIGLPLRARAPRTRRIAGVVLSTPSELLVFLDKYFRQGHPVILLESLQGEDTVLIEKMVEGQEFSCIVIQNENDKPIALPPTQIIKSTQVFDYRAKYLPGITRKITPIDLPREAIEKIRTACSALYDKMHFNVYARIDGFYTKEGAVVLNDPNTTSGMLPSSFFFHQAAEIGLNPSQFLSYIIRTSLIERLKGGRHLHKLYTLLYKLDQSLEDQKLDKQKRKRVAVIMGGYSTERHISVESGRNVFEKLSSSTKYAPFPVFLTENNGSIELYRIPVRIMLKDNADDIRDKVLHPETVHPVIENIWSQTEAIRKRYHVQESRFAEKIDFVQLKDLADEVFIALHGRPGEDGQLQIELEKLGLPYNGSGPKSSMVTIDKYETNKRLRNAGFLVANHCLVSKDEWQSNGEQLWEEIEKNFHYPVICKPHDDGCSSAVKKIKNREELQAFAEMIFRDHADFPTKPATVLHLKPTEEFPQKHYFLLEELIESKGAAHFLEITGGMLTHLNKDGGFSYEVFEPSETLSSGEVLSLEEKFLAGEGQNITPARYSSHIEHQKIISTKVRGVLEQVARTLNIEGYCRIDAFVRIFSPENIEVIIIEINSLPGMTPATCIFHQAALQDYKPYEFIDQILEYGATRVPY